MVTLEEHELEMLSLPELKVIARWCKKREAAQTPEKLAEYYKYIHRSAAQLRRRRREAHARGQRHVDDDLREHIEVILAQRSKTAKHDWLREGF